MRVRSRNSMSAAKPIGARLAALRGQGGSDENPYALVGPGGDGSMEFDRFWGPR